MYLASSDSMRWINASHSAQVKELSFGVMSSVEATMSESGAGPDPRLKPRSWSACRDTNNSAIVTSGCLDQHSHESMARVGDIQIHGDVERDVPFGRWTG